MHHTKNNGLRALATLIGLTLMLVATGLEATCRADVVRSSSATFQRLHVTVDHLTCEYLVNPLGIDTPSPRFSWQETSNRADYVQSAYRLIVATSPRLLAAAKGNLWDTGKVSGSQSTLVPYHGRTLQSRVQCWWAVKIWNAHGVSSGWSKPASFSMGLLAKRDWRGRWIGKAAVAPLASLSILRSARWIWFPDAGNPSVAAPLGTRYFCFGLDVKPGRLIKRAIFVGTADNAFTLYINGRKAGKSSDWYQVQRINVTALLHSGHNIVAVKASNVGNSGPNPAGLIGALKVVYRDRNVSVVTTDAKWQVASSPSPGWTTDSTVTNSWKPALDLGPNGMLPWGDLKQSDQAEHPPLPARYFRRQFRVGNHLARAVAYVCGLGFFKLYLNGISATNSVMDPALSDYRKADYYVTIDVTRILHRGNNAIGVILGNGRFYPPRSNAVNFGLPRLLMQLEMTYSNGYRQTVVSDSRWQVTDKGPIRANNEYDGEVYDARMAMPGWSKPGYRASPRFWSAANVMPAPGGTLEAQMLEPMRVTRVVHPIGISSPKPGIYEVDMGRTFYGTVRLLARGRRGTTVRMTSAYSLLPDGLLKTADNRSALATDVYSFAGKGKEIWNPIFKGQGFRRVQVTGFPGKPKTSSFEGLVEHTDVRPVGSFSCSNALVNKIHLAMRATMTMFLRSAPLDPDRDERMPWMGDPSKDSESEAYNFDVAAFYTKWMDDVRRSQRPDGTIPDVSMYWEGGSGVEWPSVFTIIPDWFTGFYADNRLARRNYSAMKTWVLAMERIHALPDGTLHGVGYGDWCDTYTIGGKISDFGMTPLDLVATAYQYNNVRIMQRTAQRLAYRGDMLMWKAMGHKLYVAFMHRFFNGDNCTYSSGTQCSYVLPLAFGLLPPDPNMRHRIVNNLVHDIMVTHNGHLTVGLIGNQWLMQVLTNCGRSDVAWRIVTQTTRPSWGYMILKGAQTIWERWDYDTRGPGMNSEALLIQAGNVDSWFYQTLAGINYDPARPGFAHIIIHPHLLGDLKWVRCHFNSPHGLIVSNWTRKGNIVTMQVTVPANTTATVTTPDGTARELGSGSWTLKTRVPQHP